VSFTTALSFASFEKLGTCALQETNNKKQPTNKQNRTEDFINTFFYKNKKFERISTAKTKRHYF
tara:strand:- start:572 stop:763 length:192 start_codon:yes stop_codon:yes gene_type:complete